MNLTLLPNRPLTFTQYILEVRKISRYNSISSSKHRTPLKHALSRDTPAGSPLVENIIRGSHWLLAPTRIVLSERVTDKGR